MRNQMKLRILSLTMAAAMGLTLFAGCSSANKAKDENKNTEQQDNKPKPVLKHLGNFAGFDVNADPTAKAIEEKTGYKVEYFELPAENANEKLSLEIASNNSYDSLKLNKGQYNLLTSQGALLDIDSLLEKHGSNIKATIGKELWDTIKVNGKLYGVPEGSSKGGIVNTAIAVRADILEKLGLKMPTTPDEFYNVCKTIKEKTGMLPIAADSTDVLLDSVYSAFGMALPWTDMNGQLVPRVEHPQAKAYVEFMAKLYKEQLLDPDLPVNKRTNVKEKFSNGQAAMMRFAYFDAPTVLPALEKNVPGAKVEFIDPLAGENKERGLMISKGVSWVAAIPKTSKNAEDVIKWYDSKLEVENHKYISLGQEGTHYTVKDGKYYPILPAFEKDRNNSSWYLTGTDNERYATYWQARVRKNEYMSTVFDKINKVMPEVEKTDVLTWAPILPKSAKNQQALQVLEKDSFIKFIAGDGNTKGYDEFLKKWNSSGGEEVKKEVNEWYKSSKK